MNLVFNMLSCFSPFVCLFFGNDFSSLSAVITLVETHVHRQSELEDAWLSPCDRITQDTCQYQMWTDSLLLSSRQKQVDTMLTVSVKVNRSSSLGPFNPIEAQTATSCKWQHVAVDKVTAAQQLLVNWSLSWRCEWVMSYGHCNFSTARVAKNKDPCVEKWKFAASVTQSGAC